jgi:peptidoglycan/LPS O-acetylase OafA/YrhL
MTSSARILQLDILRIIAVFLVLGRHADGFPVDEYGRLVSFLTDTWARCGWIGVDLFFVLSGFLVSGILFREYIDREAIDFKRFLIRRGFKIYPAFYTLILITIIGAIGQNLTLDRHRVWSELLFVQNYFPALWTHTWSLAVEEHFYLLLPVVLVLLSRGQFRQLPGVLAFVACLLLVFRILTVHTSGLTDFNILYKTHLRLDSLCFGVLLSYYFHFKPACFTPFQFVARHPILVLAFVSAMLAPAVLFTVENSVFLNTVGLSLLYLGFGTLLIGVLHWDSVGRFTSTNLGSFLAYLGARSYSIYLWHMPVKEWGVPLLDKVFGTTPHVAAFCFYMVGSVAFGVWMARIVEFPALKVRDYLFPRRIKSRVSSADRPPDIGGGRSGQGKAA